MSFITKTEQRRSADGSLSVGEAIDQVMALYPGADREALRLLAWALTVPRKDKAEPPCQPR